MHLLATNEPVQIEQAVTELKRALLLETDNSFGWFELARAYSALDNDVMALLATAESRFHAGAKPEANQFARRAMAGLQRGSAEWRQAADIIVASQPAEGGPPLPGGIGENAPRPRQPSESDRQKPDVPDPETGE